MAAHNLHDISKKTLGGVLPVVLNQFIDDGDGRHPGVVSVVKKLVLILHKLMGPH